MISKTRVAATFPSANLSNISVIKVIKFNTLFLYRNIIKNELTSSIFFLIKYTDKITKIKSKIC